MLRITNMQTVGHAISIASLVLILLTLVATPRPGFAADRESLQKRITELERQIVELRNRLDRLEKSVATPQPGIPSEVKSTGPSQITPDFQTISLQAWSELTSPETNLGLGPGLNHLRDIPFETGWKASTQCSYLPKQPTSFQLGMSISNPVDVYLLIQAGWGRKEYVGKQIGNVRIEFSGGSTIDTPLILGSNIRDWSRKDPAAVNTVSSDTSQPAWEGTTPDGTSGGMDILTITIPSNQLQSTLTGIQISDLSQSTIGNINPCIHLVALTAKYLH